MSEQTELIENRQPANMAQLEQVSQVMAQMARMMQTMSDTIRATNERMDELTRQVRAQVMREPITGTQERALQAAIRSRAARAADDYGADGKAALRIANMIRLEVRRQAEDGSGVRVRSISDLPACLYDVAREQIELWDNYAAVKRAMRGGA